MEQDNHIFRSRYSVVLLAFALMIVGSLVFVAVIEKSASTALAAGIMMIVIVLVFFGVKYEISGEKLVFKSWGIKVGDIDIHAITKIERSYLVLSSNSSSMKRLYITLKKRSKYPYLLISPVREDEFIEMLTHINPSIEIKMPPKTDSRRSLRDWDI